MEQEIKKTNNTPVIVVGLFIIVMSILVALVNPYALIGGVVVLAAIVAG